MSRSTRSPLVVLFLLATMAQAMLADASARGGVSVGRVPVRYRDLDLRNEADAQVLLRRLERAAVTACGGNPKFQATYELMPKHTTEVFEACRRDALAKAVAAVDAPELSRAFAAAHAKGKCRAMV